MRKSLPQLRLETIGHTGPGHRWTSSSGESDQSNQEDNEGDPPEKTTTLVTLQPCIGSQSINLTALIVRSCLAGWEIYCLISCIFKSSDELILAPMSWAALPVVCLISLPDHDNDPGPDGDTGDLLSLQGLLTSVAVTMMRPPVWSHWAMLTLSPGTPE